MATVRRKGARAASSQRSAQLLARILVGSGLVILGLLAFVLLSRPGTPQTGSRAAGSEASVVPVAVNFEAPALEMTDLQGQPVSLADYRGKFVLVNNWATWCPPCKAEMPTLQAYYDDYRNQGFTLIAIEAGEPVGEVQDFVSEYKLSFQVWPDPQQKALAAFRNVGLPSSYLIDPAGKVRLTWTGAISREMLDQYVTPLLED